MTLETLSTIKNPPVVYAKQANIAHGPQQVNNGAGPPRAVKISKAPNKLLEQSNEIPFLEHEIPVDPGTSATSGNSNSAMEAMGEVDGSPNR